MTPSLRALPLVVSITLASGLWGTRAVIGAQIPNGSAEATKTESKTEPKKPTRKPDQVITNDPVALLAVRKAPPYIEPPAAAAATATTEAGAVPVDPEKRAAEIASVEKQIQDKQKRIVLLMRLFVDDERQFVNDPAHPKGDEASQDRRKYEQDELLYETSQLAKLKARLKELAAAKSENTKAEIGN